MRESIRQFQFLNFLGALNLSNDDLSGRIPRGGQRETFEASSFVGNPEPCGDPLKRKCSYEVQQSNPPLSKVNEEEEEESDSEDMWWHIAVGDQQLETMRISRANFRYTDPLYDRLQG
eukprot:Gb_13360 [translate_table: standard]